MSSSYSQDLLPDPVDPFTLEIIRHDLVSIPNQIEKNIERTAFSSSVQEYKDYAVGIVSPSGEMVSQCRGSLLIFVANALGTAVRDGQDIYGTDNIFDGDVIITNHAGTMGQHLDTVNGSWGASAHDDGAGPFRSNAHGDTLDVPIERQEASYPCRLDWKEFRPDSGGPGKFRGGRGVEKMYTVLAPCRITTKMERTKCPPWGLQGGQAGKTGSIEVLRTSGETVSLAKDETSLKPGDRVHVCSGGGYGPPWERSLDRVAEDLAQGYVSAQGAVSDYAVVFDDRGTLDQRATEEHRGAIVKAV